MITILSHGLIKEKLTELIERTLTREGLLTLDCNKKRVFFTSGQPERCNLNSYQTVCDALHYHLVNIFIRFGSKNYRQIVCFHMVLIAPLLFHIHVCFVMRETLQLSLSDNS